MTSQAFKEKIEALNNLMLTRLAIRQRKACATREAKLQEALDEANAAKAARAKWLAGDRDED